MPISKRKESVFKIPKIYTNYLIAISKDPKAIIRLLGITRQTVGHYNVQRALILNVAVSTIESVYQNLPEELTQQKESIYLMDITNGEYFYDETWFAFCETIINDKGVNGEYFAIFGMEITGTNPALLCQFITTEELTPAHLIELQDNDIDNLTVINHWHAKPDVRKYDKRTMILGKETAGYLKMAGAYNLTDKQDYKAKVNLPHFYK